MTLSHDPLQKMRKAPGIVRLHGHRGARGIWPENTLIGFQGAMDMGIQAIELDVLLTKDNVPVVTHNPKLMIATSRDKNGQWLSNENLNVAELHFDELRQIDVGGILAGSTYASLYPDQAFLFGQNIPALEDIARLFCRDAYQNVWMNLEIKSTPLGNHVMPSPKALAENVLSLIAEYGLDSRTIIQCFDWRVLREVERIAPSIPRSYLTYMDCPAPVMAPNIYVDSPWMAGTSYNDKSELCEIIVELGGAVWSPFHKDLTMRDVERAQSLGLIVNAWTVNEKADFDRMIEFGVDGIITDYSNRAQRHLLKRGLVWHDNISLPK